MRSATRANQEPPAVGAGVVLCALLFLLTTLPVLAAPPRGLTYVKNRLVFVNTDAEVTSGTLRVQAWQKQGLQQQGYDPPALDPESGIPFFSQRSAFTIRSDSRGDLVVHRERATGSRVPDMSSDAENIRIPIATEPGAAFVPLLAHHPLAMALDDFGLLPRFGTPVETHQTTDTLTEAYEDAQWRFEVDRDLATHHPREIRRIHKPDHVLCERARYDGWYQAPSGRWMPRNATLRTFKGDIHHPVVQVEFQDIKELPD